MTARVLKMIQLAWEKKHEKQVQESNLKKKNKESIDSKTFFEPIVQNETHSVLNGFSFNVNALINKFNNVNTSRSNLSDILPKKVIIDENNITYSDPDFDSDDTVRDPNFHITSEQESSSEEENFTNEELASAGHQIEQNLANDVTTIVDPNINIDSKQTLKKKRNCGKAYVNKSGPVLARQCIPLANSCRKNCKNKISFTMQKQVFDYYWSLGSYDKRLLYMSGLISIEEKKTQSTCKEKQRNRQHSTKYYIEFQKQRTIVCQKCFLQSFGESAGFIKSLQKKKLNLNFSDERGHATPKNKLSDSIVQSVKDHIYSFPAYESHYSRRHSSKKYLSSDLTVAKMYDLYIEKFRDNNISLSSYSRIFQSTELKFKAPKLDSCHHCDILKAKLEVAKNENALLDINRLQEELSDHHSKADLAYKSKQNDKILSTENKTIKTYSFDLQQCLPTPYLNTSVAFYKRLLWTYNLTIHDGATSQPHCYIWHEGLAKRGGNEISSCLFKHLHFIDKNIQHVIFYSDSCPGQNKNSFLSSMFLFFLHNNEHIKVIDHKFLVPGHTHMECDTDHSVIERRKKRTHLKIHHPRDWANFIRTVGKKQTFDVVEMEKDNFYDFSSLLKNKFVWRKSSTNNEPFRWKDVNWLRYDKSHFGTVFYKTSLDVNEEFKILNIIKRGVYTVNLNDLQNISAEVLISTKKKEDLIDLLPLIDTCLHQFYKNLKTENTDVNEDPDLEEESESEN